MSLAEDELTTRDVEQIRGTDRDPAEIARQIEVLRRGSPVVELLRPCTVGDGVRVLESRLDAIEESWEEAALEARLVQFVPASGAATRMCAALVRLREEGGDPTIEALEARRDAGEAWLDPAIRTLAHLDQSALGAAVGPRKGVAAALRALLDDLRAADLPKGLLPFHRYDGATRTAFEEHLVEAASLVTDRDRRCRLHFTVSVEHLEEVRAHLAQVAHRHERRLGVAFDLTLSVQHPATDAVAVDPSGAPIRDEQGDLLFRPGGHGALVRNLGELAADVVLVKNIDNIVSDRWRGNVVPWRRRLVGLLVELQRRAHALVRRLADGDGAAIGPAVGFLRDELGEHVRGERDLDVLRDRLDRPFRVCAVVENTGEPGGGPFWVRDAERAESRQIVEKAQIDPEDERQRAILRASTHFNPVDMACGLRDAWDRPYDLQRFVDPGQAIVTRKRVRGVDALVYEHPGLWNGGMGRWNTVFVEVPEATFAPVKTTADLLRDAHR